MTSTAPLAYPAEYYYPEFIDSRTDDPRISAPTRFPLTTSVDNGIGLSTQIPASFQQVDELDVSRKPSNKKQGPVKLALDVATNQGLPDSDINQAARTDAKKNLLRDPVERNIPRLIVDDSLFNKNMLTAGLGDNPLVFDEPVEAKQAKKPADGRKSVSNGHINGGPRSKSKMSHDAMSAAAMKQQSLAFIEEEPPIDDYWKKEVHIDEEGGVSIERLHYDRNAHNGPFGMTRQGSTIFYVSMGILAVLGAVFLIMTGVFYSKSYPDSSSNTAKLAGMGICALVFYVCLQLILIGLWHQKYRQENPKRPTKTIDPHDESKARLKSSMENNAQYDYSHPQQMDYTPYGGYPATPYGSNVNEQMLLQQPGAATGAAFYDPVVWPSNVELESQPDSRFYQPMEAVYGPPTGFERQTPHYVPLATVTDSRPKKKSNRNDTSKTISAEQPQANFDNIFPNSTVADTNIPVLKKAPETNELLQKIEEMERNQVRTSGRRTSTVKTSNRVNPVDGRTEISSLDTSNARSHRDQRPRHRRRHNRHHRRSSMSPCSTCSDRSRGDFHSDVAVNARPRHGYTSKMLGARPSRAHTLSPTAGARSKLRSTGMGTDFDSGYTVGIEDVPNVRDDRDEQIPVVRRTIIVEPYPATPNTQVLLKPNTAQGGKGLSVETSDINGENDQDMYQSTDTLSKKSKKKKKTVAGRDHSRGGDLRLEDVNDDDPKYNAHYSTDGGSRKKRTTTNQRSAQQTTSSYYQ